MIRRRTIVTTALGLAALSACTGGDSEGSQGAGTGGRSDGGGEAGAQDGTASAPSPEEVFPEAAATAVIPWGQSELVVGVRPIVRYEDRLVLTLDLQLEGADEDVPDDLLENVAKTWKSDVVPDGGGDDMLRGVRLVDLVGDAVAGPALDVEGSIVSVADEPEDEGIDAQRRRTLQIAYGDLGTTTVGLFLPKAGLLPDLSVSDGEIPAVENAPRSLDVLTVDEAPVTPMITRAFDLLAPLREENDGETSTVSIGSDVLFDSSSAELSADAKAVLDVAAERIGAHEPGDVMIVGHTDDVGDDASNVTLSQRRAEAVATALGERIDPADYPMETVGKGEAEPLAENEDDAGRAKNRRVELMISTPMRSDTGGEATRAPFDGVEATGDEGLELENFDGRPYRLRAPQARIVAEHLVATLEVEMLDEVVDEGGLGGLSRIPGGTLASYDDEFELLFSHGGLGVLSGSLLTLPAMHRLVDDESTHLHPLGDLNTNARLDGGIPVTYELVYPRGVSGIEPGGTAVLQLDRDELRLIDIPIAD